MLFRSIASEADLIASGQHDRENNPLRRAPHTVEDLVGEWDRPIAVRKRAIRRALSVLINIGRRSIASTMFMAIAISSARARRLKATPSRPSE